LETNYFFEFQTYDKIPSNSKDGALLIDFPREFAFQKHESLECYPWTEEYALTLWCNMTYDRVYIEGNSLDFSGRVSLNVNGILNPLTETATKNFYVKSFDGFNVKIIESSYPNLDPISFNYVYPGEIVIVN